MDEARLVVEACSYVFKKMEGAESIVCASIISAVEGKFGNYHMLARTREDPDSKLFICPLMSMYWAYRLPDVAAELLYIDRIRESQQMEEIVKAIESFRQEMGKPRPEAKLPF
ncbi:MAG: hypothetical protein BGO12_06655 [Verrucomicrobia bacterium 61-8]|nr:MAG: hypothetical protein BGO12_06655 [Verrucomicrobia bacterium 61-8]